MKRTEIKWEDFFHCYELSDKKLNVSNDAKKKMGDYKNDSDERKKMLCSFPFENNSDLYTEENYPECLPSEQYDFYKSIFDDMAFKDLKVFNGDLNITNVFFANPMYFIRTCDELGMFEFNPYANNSLADLDNLKNNINDKRTGKAYDLSKNKLDNPGFAPYIGIKNSNANSEGYAKVNGYFMQDYGNYGHEGVDFTANGWIARSKPVEEHTPIHSLINGVVVKMADHGAYNYGLHMIISDGKDKLYLLGHLCGYAKGIKVGSIVANKTVVGYVGNTGNCAGYTEADKEDGRGSHLHLSIFKFEDDFAKTVLDMLKISGKAEKAVNDKIRIKDPRYTDVYTYNCYNDFNKKYEVINPFIHSESRSRN